MPNNLKTIKLFLVFWIFLPKVVFSQDSAVGENFVGRIDTSFLRSVVNIQTISGTGSGFVVKTSDKYFLVTNKHVIGDFKLSVSESYFDSIGIHFYNENATNSIFKIVKLKDNKGELLKTVKSYPSLEVDVAAIDITRLYLENSKIGKFYIPIENLIPLDSVTNYGVGFGSQVFAIGYPANIKFATTNLPIAKSGFVASSLSGRMDILVQIEKGKPPFRFKRKFFMVDGLIIGGNSGGPIIVPKDFKFLVTKDLRFDGMEYPQQNAVLGLVSFGWENTGLTIIFPSDYVRELVHD